MSNFEPQCKTSADVHREWARVLDMCDGTNVSPSICLKHSSDLMISITRGINFNLSPFLYEFAIAIVEGKPVFRGDVLYDVRGIKYVAGYAKEHEQIWAKPDEPFLYGTSDSGHTYFCQIKNAKNFSWNPPKPKTFSLIDIPMPKSHGWNTIRSSNHLDIHFEFNNPHDCHVAATKIIEAMGFKDEQ